MEVNDELVERLAGLARLKFNDQEKAGIRMDLQQMISFIEKLQEADTTGIQPLLYMSENVNILRDDVVHGSVSREDALRNAPEHDGVYFKVPKVIKK